MPGLPYRIDLPQLALLLANLLPLIGVLWFDWDVGSIVVLYWAENLIVGAYTVLRMLTTGGVHALFQIAFFCLHYGGFCAIHGLFVLKLTGFADLDQAVTRGLSLARPAGRARKVRHAGHSRYWQPHRNSSSGPAWRC